MFKVSPVTALLECPHCCKLLPFQTMQCPDCREPISEQYAFASAMVVAFNTQACGSANDVKSSDSSIAIVLAGSVLIYLDDLYVFGSPRLFLFVVLWSLVPLSTTLYWFYRFGRFGLGDEKYSRAKREMKGYLKLWLAILALQVAVLYAGWS
jgi:hypothetical protein